jgi:hypothetical protein
MESSEMESQRYEAEAMQKCKVKQWDCSETTLQHIKTRSRVNKMNKLPRISELMHANKSVSLRGQ